MSENDNKCWITEENYPDFKKKYEEAVKKQEETFWFEGQAVLTQYAQYVTKYVDGRLTKQGKRV